MFTANALAYLSIFSGIFPVIAALFNYRYLDKALKIAVVYFLASVLSDLLQQIFKYNGIYNNWPVIHIYIVVSILLLGAMYYSAFINPLLKKVIAVTTALVFVVFITNIIFVDGLLDYPSLSNTILSMVLICFSLIYFYQLLSLQEFVHIEKQGLFWINAGILIYFAINIFLFMLFKRMMKEHQEGFYIINNITNIIANILFTIGLLCKPQKKATSSQY